MNKLPVNAEKYEHIKKYTIRTIFAIYAFRTMNSI